MQIRKNFFIGINILLCLLIYAGTSSAIDEKEILKKSYFGDFTNAKLINKSGKVSLKRWEPYAQHVRSLPGPRVEPEGIASITISYDEVWVAEDKEGFPDHVKRRLKGQFDIHKLYWLKNKIQGSALERYFTGNPVTGSSFNHPTHKLIILYGREEILSKLK